MWKFYIHNCNTDTVLSIHFHNLDVTWGCRSRAMVLGNVQGPGHLLIWIIGQGPTAPAVGAGGGYLDFFLSPLFSQSLVKGSKQTKILSQRAAKHNTN